MTLAPNTPITQENVGLLKAGDWLRYDVQADVLPHNSLVRFLSMDQIDGQDLLIEWDGDGTNSIGGWSPESFTYIGPDLGDGWIGWGGGRFKEWTRGLLVEVKTYNGLISPPQRAENVQWTNVVAFRPALAKPAEREATVSDAANAQIVGWERVHGFDMPVAKYATPTPPSIDWSVVGPKLVEALESAKPYQNGSGHQYWRMRDADYRAALAAAQPQSNGDDR